MNCLLIIAHPNPLSFENNKLLKTIGMSYKREGHNINVIDLYKDGYNPSMFVGDLSKINNNAFSKSYRHQIKTSDHIWIISPTRWLTLSPLIEGFIDQVFINGFAFSGGKGLLTDKKIGVVITSTANRSLMWRSLDILRIRLRFMVFPQIFKFKNIKIHQIWDVNRLSNLEQMKELLKIKKTIYRYL